MALDSSMAREAKKRTLKVEGAVLYHETRGEGPLLVMIPGGPTDADVLTSLAELLADRFKVVTYDPRGNSRSRIDGEPIDQDLDLHGDDLTAVIREFDEGPAFVFGNSGGAQIGLNACARYPQVIRRLIAHEPPCTTLLPEVAQLVRAMNQIKETFHKSGATPAMSQFMQMAGVTPPARILSDSGEPRPPSPFMKLNVNYFLEHGMLPIALFTPDVEKLRHSEVVVAIGAQTEGQLANRTGVALAKALGREPIVFPGDHSGWVREPAEFAQAIAAQLT